MIEPKCEHGVSMFKDCLPCDVEPDQNRNHYRYKMLHFLEVEMDIAKQADNDLRRDELLNIYKYIERNEYGADYMEAKYGE